MLKRLLLLCLVTVGWAQAPALTPALTGMSCANLILSLTQGSLCTLTLSGPAPPNMGTITATYGTAKYVVTLTLPGMTIPVSISSGMNAYSTAAPGTVVTGPGTLSVAIPGGQSSGTFTVNAVATLPSASNVDQLQHVAIAQVGSPYAWNIWALPKCYTESVCYGGS